MLGWVIVAIVGIYGAGTLYAWLARDPLRCVYLPPDEAAREIEQLARHHPDICTCTVIGHSTQGRPIQALRLSAPPDASSPARHPAGETRPRLLVTGNIHASEYVAGYVARAVARRLTNGYGRAGSITRLLDQVDVWVVPLLNPDGAARIWRHNGFGGLGSLRYTAKGVDPNRNFPLAATGPFKGWNSASNRARSPYYRGPHPLSEPECLALARLCERERFFAAINFHSFGGVVFMPAITGGEGAKAADALAVFAGFFQSRQRYIRYRPVPERSRAIQGQLDPFLLGAFGTPSVTIEVSRLGLHVLKPWRTFSFFWWANPGSPDYWARNDVDATIAAMAELLLRTGGTPCTPAQPELAADFEQTR